MADAEQIQRAIQAQEQLRDTLPDEVVDATIAALRSQLPGAPTPSPEGRRRQVTVLFADVSGFTAMSETRDAELVMDLMNSLWERLDAVVVEHGGRIDKHIGDALMAIWGTEVAQEDDAECAVRAALELQDALAAFRTTGEDQLAMRVGVNTGQALVGSVGTTGEFSAIGDAVNVASRLEQAAPVGRVLISHDTYRHVRGIFDVEPLGRLQVKGKQEGVPAYAVQRARPRAFRIAPRGVEGVDTRTIGRDDELDQVRAAYRAVVDDGTARVVTVIGDAGIGKSRLLYEYEAWIDLLPEEVFFFKGRAFSNRVQVPFALVRDVIATRFDILDSDPAVIVQAKVRAGFLGLLDQQEADVVGHWIGLDMDSDTVRRLAGSPEFATAARSHLVTFFRTLLAEDPMTLILEDLHWADDESLDLLGHLTDQLAGMPLLVVGTARPELLERRDRAPDGIRIQLDALPPVVAAALVREVLQRVVDVPDDLVDVIARRSDGNPFFAEELVLMLIDHGVIVTDDDGWRVELGRFDVDDVPATLTAVLLARLDRLAHEELRALQHAAVVGRVFWEAAVAALAPSDDVVDALTATRDRAFVFTREPSSFDGTREYAFKHALLRDVTYETVLIRDRRPLHRAAAEWIETVAGDRIGEFRELVADHYVRAEEPGRAAASLLAAGLACRDKAHIHAARRALLQAATLTSEAGGALPDEATVAMGEVCYRLGDLEAAQRAVDTVIEATRDPATVADALFWSSRIADAQGDAARERALLDRALEILEPIAGVTHARVLASLTQWEAHHGDLEVARAFGRQALESSEPGSIERTEAHSALAIVASMAGDLDVAEDHARRAAENARATGNLQLEASTLTNLGVLAHLRGDDGDDAQYEVADRYYAQAYAIAVRIGMPAAIGIAAINRAQVSVRQGNLDDAAALVRESLHHAADTGARVDMLFGIVIEADRLASAGDDEQAMRLLGTAAHDPSANLQLDREIERVGVRLGIPADEVAGRLVSDGDHDLDTAVAGILGADH
jgi:class 3 adenylate cyclase/tetratricopeptide (TPR) repeat protein